MTSVVKLLADMVTVAILLMFLVGTLWLTECVILLGWKQWVGVTSVG